MVGQGASCDAQMVSIVNIQSASAYAVFKFGFVFPAGTEMIGAISVVANILRPEEFSPDLLIVSGTCYAGINCLNVYNGALWPLTGLEWDNLPVLTWGTVVKEYAYH